MWNRLAIALGAGVASAVLFMVTVQGTALAVALAYLAPLPVMIATLGWGIDVGAVAMGVACALVAGAVAPVFGLLIALTVALPCAIFALSAARTTPSRPSAPASARLLSRRLRLALRSAAARLSG